MHEIYLSDTVDTDVMCLVMDKFGMKDSCYDAQSKYLNFRVCDGTIPTRYDIYDAVAELAPQADINIILAPHLAYLRSTDWVEPYLIKHTLGLEILPDTSNKLVISLEREAVRAIIAEITASS